VRADPDLLAELDDLVRQRLVPASFSDQVDAGLRLLVRAAADEQTRRGGSRSRPARSRRPGRG
jgi:hypothetical protein